MIALPPFGRLVSLLILAATLAGCKTAEDRRMEDSIQRKRAHLDALRSQLVDLDGQVTRQQALLRLQQSKVDAAAAENRITRSERDAAQAEVTRDRATLEDLRRKIADRQREAGRLAQEKADNSATLERQHQLAGEIAQLRAEIRSAEDAMRQRAEQRAKHYERPS